MLELFASVSSLTNDARPNAQNIPAILNVLMLALLSGCVICWFIATIRLRNGQPLVSWQKRNCVSWNLIDTFVAVVLQLLFIFVGAMAFAMWLGVDFSDVESKSLSADQQISMMVFGEISMLTAAGLTATYLVMRSGATTADLGLATSRIGHNLLIGVVAFFMLIMPILLLQLGLEKLFPSAGNHPFVDLLREHGDDSMLRLIFVMAVIIAPIVEEFLFRVVIQGWLERFVTARTRPSNMENVQDTGNSDVSGERQPDSADVVESESPYDSPTSSLLAEFNPLTNRDPIEQNEPSDVIRTWIPIVIASALFAGAHLGHGTAPIPLFFLSLGLGYVYHRTHTIWPSMVAHLLVNLLAVAQLKIALDNGIPM